MYFNFWGVVMKTIRLLVVSVIVVLLVGCDGFEPQPANKPSVPDLGTSQTIAYFDEGNKIVNVYPTVGIVCIEQTRIRYGTRSTVQDAAFSCWDIDTAPKVLKSLVSKWKLNIPQYGEQREWPPQK